MPGMNSARKSAAKMRAESSAPEARLRRNTVIDGKVSAHTTVHAVSDPEKTRYMQRSANNDENTVDVNLSFILERRKISIRELTIAPQK
jgi:hypothetical protein